MSKYHYVCVLDIDGVLNSDQYYKTRPDEDNRPYPISEFDPNAIYALNRILLYCDQLILCSDWRFTEGIQNILKEAGVNRWAVDNMLTTPYLGNVFTKELRGHEVDFVIKALKKDHTNVSYVILDDNNYYMNFQEKHLLQTNYKYGLTEEDVEKAVDILLNRELYESIGG